MQRCWYMTVRDRGPAGFLAEANYADTLIDQTLILEIERKTLVIKSAVLEVHRGQPGATASAPVPALVGITAYFGSGKQLRQALAADPVLIDMASQTFTAVIQAEVFFYQERGFATAENYEDYWDQTSKNSCVYYSNLDRLGQRFMDYVKDQERGSNLFHRYLLTAIEDVPGENLEIRAHLMDSYHEMSIVLQLDQVLQIRQASATMLRCPDPVCREALARFDGLKGLTLTAAEMRRYQSICGGASGCTHITHLVQEAAYTLDKYKSNKQSITKQSKPV